jgi:hypothetical protein
MNTGAVPPRAMAILDAIVALHQATGFYPTRRELYCSGRVARSMDDINKGIHMLADRGLVQVRPANGMIVGVCVPSAEVQS